MDPEPLARLPARLGLDPRGARVRARRTGLGALVLTRLAAAALALALALAATGAHAAPDLAAPRQLGSFRVFPDFSEPHRFYLAPGDLEIAIDERGRPKLHFLQMRYTGTQLYGNAGESGSFSTLTLGVAQAQPTAAELRFLVRSLQSLANLGRVELRPLPITAFEAMLVYAPIGELPGSGAEGAASELEVAGTGYFEAEDRAEAKSDPRTFWRERTFTVPLDEKTSTLFWDLLQRQELALSLSYAFFSHGIHSNELAQVDVDATERDVEKQLLDQLRGLGVPIAPQPKKGIAAQLLERIRAKLAGEAMPEPADEGDDELPQRSAIVHSGATAIRVDAKRFPELFQRVDWNDEAPPAYAVVKVYCYDFANALRPDLFYKKVEIEAQGVGGRAIPLDAKFLFSQPDLYARTIRFPVAVHVDRPFRYRVISAMRDGRTDEGPWLERSSWGGILDITSAPSEGPQQGLEDEG